MGPFRIVGCPGRRENLPCTSRGRCLASRAPFGRVGSSVVEQRPFKPLVVGSNPTRPTTYFQPDFDGSYILLRGPRSISASRRHSIRTRSFKPRGQPEFRRKLLAAYGGRCAVSGCDAAEVLEAAHVVPYRGPGTNQVWSGFELDTG